MTAADLPVSSRDIELAARRLVGHITRTPVLRSRTLDERLGATLHLKAEHLQRTGAFKIRGATNALAAIDPATHRAGVVAFSSGNHAQAVACAAAARDIPVTIVMPTDAPPVKLAATRGYGAEVVLYDRFTEDRHALAARIASERGATLIPPFDDPTVIAGQGTAVQELLEEVPDLDLLVVPTGGAGLLAGSTVAATAAAPGIEIVGVEPADRPAARQALAQDRVVEVPVVRTVLDGQQTTHIGHHALAILQANGVRVVGVGDDAVLGTVRTLAIRMKQVVEPSGASALAALLDGRVEAIGRRIGVVLSGGNITPQLLRRAMRRDGPSVW